MADAFVIEGLVETEENILREIQKIWYRVADAFYQEALRIMEIAKSRTPVRSGALRDSGIVFPPEISQNEIRITMSFGGDSITYAIVVHERLDVVHVIGQAKFLESVMLEEMGSILPNILRLAA